MMIWMNAAVRRRLAGSALGGLVVFAAIPVAMAQWLPPWRAVASPGDIAQRLEAHGYQLIAPLQRRLGVFLADVRAGSVGIQRLVIDDRSGEILERFMSSPRGPDPEFAVRFDEFGEPPPGAVQPLPGRGFPDAPNGGPAAKSAYGGPTNVHIPSAISPYGSQAPVSTKPKPQPAPTARKVPSPMIAPPLPPPAPREAQTQSPDSALDPTAKPTAPASSAEASDKPKVSIVPPALFE
jgi:hypothetical protein